MLRLICTGLVDLVDTATWVLPSILSLMMIGKYCLSQVHTSKLLSQVHTSKLQLLYWSHTAELKLLHFLDFTGS